MWGTRDVLVYRTQYLISRTLWRDKEIKRQIPWRVMCVKHRMLWEHRRDAQTYSGSQKQLLEEMTFELAETWRLSRGLKGLGRSIITIVVTVPILSLNINCVYLASTVPLFHSQGDKEIQLYCSISIILTLHRTFTLNIFKKAGDTLTNLFLKERMAWHIYIGL